MAGHRYWGARWQDRATMPEGFAPTGTRSDHRHGSSAGAVGRADRLGVSRRALRLGVPTGPWSTWLADAAGGGPFHSQAHAQPIGRGAVRAVDREPVFPVLLRRAELLPQAALRPLVADAPELVEGGGSAWTRSSSWRSSRRACRWRTRPAPSRPRISSGSLSTRRCSRRRSRIRPMRG